MPTGRDACQTYFTGRLPFENCKQLIGLGEQANRLPKGVERTTPVGFSLYSMVIVWFHLEGHHFLRIPFRPWYTKKEEPSFADLLTTMRRVSYEEKIPPLLPKQCCLRTWIAQIVELLCRAA